jgi:hypothetical protein
MVLAWVLAIPVTLQAQSANDAEAPGDSAVERTFRSRADSLEWSRARARAENARGLHLVVSLQDRRIWVRRDDDTLRTAEAGVASGLTIEYAGRSWTFRTPRGRHTVQRKMTEPVWTPPDWMYAEAALEHDLELGRLNARSRVPVGDGRMLVIRQGRADAPPARGRAAPRARPRRVRSSARAARPARART